MSSAFIREGDTTSHGGRVLACMSTNIVFGKGRRSVNLPDLAQPILAATHQI